MDGRLDIDSFEKAINGLNKNLSDVDNKIKINNIGIRTNEKITREKIPPAKEEIRNLINDFSLPRYNDIPNVGLYLEQVVKYISEYLEPLGSFSLTASMVSNYVKKGLIENPVKKQYDREHIAVLLMIAVVKTVLSLEEVQKLLDGCYADAKRVLTENRALLDEIAEYLLLKETITGEELMRFINAPKPAEEGIIEEAAE